MPIRASLHFHNARETYVQEKEVVSMPIRASLHSHIGWISINGSNIDCVNAHSGFSSFPQHPSESRRNKAFSRPFLQVFI